MYHPPSKRRQLLQRVIVYSIMTSSVIILLTLLVFTLLGYQFNNADGRIEQGGLVQFDSQPAGAAVKLDNTSLGSTTPTRTTPIAGDHSVKMTKSGYDSWQKTVKVQAGGVLWLKYARLVPNDRPVTNVDTLDSVASTAASPNRKLYALVEKPAKPSILLYDLEQNKEMITPKILNLPTDSFTIPSSKKAQKFTIMTWDSDSRYLLVKHTYDDKKIEYIVVDTDEVTSTKNITSSLGATITLPTFSVESGQILYGIVEGSIRKINLDAKTISGPLVQDVAEFSMFDTSTLTYVTKPDPETKKRSVGYYTDGSSAPKVLRNYADDGKVPLHLALGKYYNEVYVSIAYGESVEIMKGGLPSSDNKAALSLKSLATMVLPDDVKYLSILTSGRFVVAQHANSYSVYDLELAKMTTTPLHTKKPMTTKLSWIDSFMPYTNANGTLRIYEFDGANQHDIMPSLSGQAVTLSPNGKYIYTVSKDAKNVPHLSRVTMIID